MKVFAEFIYQDGDSIIYKPVFIERDEDWEAYARFNELVNYYIDCYDLLYGGKSIKVSNITKARIHKRIQALAWGFDGMKIK